jgi:hypothetical protein
MRGFEQVESPITARDVPWSGDSAFFRVRQQLNRLTRRLDLKDVDGLIFRAYDAICGHSLDFSPGERPPGFSRINVDGTPFQYSANLGVPFRSLQFLGEAGRPNASGNERIRASLECIAYIASIFEANAEFKTARDLISDLAPVKDPQLITDPAGAFWIGTAFAPDRNPQLRIYINGRWGNENDRWAQFRLFASRFGVFNTWIEAEKILTPEVKPLGCALTITRGSNVTGRIYVSAYGKLIDYYERLARAVSGDQFANVLHQYAECLLGADIKYPTPTAVCSFGLVEGKPLDFKFELCIHCLFTNDVDASERLNECFSLACVDAVDYRHLLEVLAEGKLDNQALQLHCYAGVGVRQGEKYFSVYLKPKLIEV